MMLRTIKKPFSYLVPAFGFPSTVVITDMNGKQIKMLADLPSAETAPSGNDNVQNVAEVLNGEMMKQQLLFGACRLIVD
jgi:hypothetical protein